MKPAMTSILGLALAAACGDGLTDKGYPGEPRFRLTAEIRSLADNAPSSATSFGVVVWSNFMRQGDTTSSQRASLSNSALPFEFILDLFDEPPTEALNDMNHPAYGTSGFIGIGLLAIVADSDGDGALSPFKPPKDALRGLSRTHGVLFARDVNEATREALRGGLLLNPEALWPGYNLARLVCKSPGEIFDHFLVVPEEPAAIDTYSPADPGCINFN